MSRSSDARSKLLQLWSKADDVEIPVYFTVAVTEPIVEVPIWVWCSNTSSTTEDAMIAYGATLGVGDDVDYSDLDDAIEAALGFAVITAIGVSAEQGEAVQADIVIASNEISTWSVDRLASTGG